MSPLSQLQRGEGWGGEGRPIPLSGRCGAENQARHSENAKQEPHALSFPPTMFVWLQHCMSTLVTLLFTASSVSPHRAHSSSDLLQIKDPCRFLRCKNKRVLVDTARHNWCDSIFTSWKNKNSLPVRFNLMASQFESSSLNSVQWVEQTKWQVMALRYLLHVCGALGFHPIRVQLWCGSCCLRPHSGGSRGKLNLSSFPVKTRDGVRKCN